MLAGLFASDRDNPNPVTITIDGTVYEADKLSDAAKQQLGNLRLVESVRQMGGVDDAQQGHGYAAHEVYGDDVGRRRLGRADAKLLIADEHHALCQLEDRHVQRRAVEHDKPHGL